MKKLLIEEMKRAIQIMENKEEIKKFKTEVIIGYNNKPWNHNTTDRETTELRSLLLAIRKHSILLEKGIK